MAHGLPIDPHMPLPSSNGASLDPAGRTAGPVIGFHGAVSEFKRRLIEATLTQMGGNRTRTARALGLQRTYLLRLIREFGISVPAPPGPAARRPEGTRSL